MMALRTKVSFERSVSIRRHSDKSSQRIAYCLTDYCRVGVGPQLLSMRKREEDRFRIVDSKGLRQKQRAHRLGLTFYAGVWVREGVFLVFFASIEAGKILLNQERERPAVS